MVERKWRIGRYEGRLTRIVKQFYSLGEKNVFFAQIRYDTRKVLQTLHQSQPHPDKILKLPQKSVVLYGNASTNDHGITGWEWAKESCGLADMKIDLLGLASKFEYRKENPN